MWGVCDCMCQGLESLTACRCINVVQSLCLPLDITNLDQGLKFRGRKLTHMSLIVQVKSDGSKLPLRLVCYWKCEPTVTNFRLDYTYIPSALAQQTKPSLTGVVVSVPVNGRVTNALYRPEGVWKVDQSTLTWNLGELRPSEQPGKIVYVDTELRAQVVYGFRNVSIFNACISI